MRHPKRIGIIGAGIGGLTAALALLQRGFDVTVYEQSAMLKEVGAGIQIGPNGALVLHALGLKEALERLQVLPSRRHIRHWSTGETWDWFELGANAVTRFGAPYVLMHRGDLHGILADAVRGLKKDAVVLDRRCVGLSQTADHAEVRFAGGEVVRSDLVIGADGIHSKIRECLFGRGQAEFTGCVAWRGLVPMDRLPPRFAQMPTTNWLGPRGHVLHYPVRRTELMNFISFVERDDWRVESWTVEGTQDELANDFRGWHSDVHSLIGHIGTPYKWALMLRGPMERWTEGRAMLLGDACHPTLPFLGQGAVMAIEDAYVIAACLEKYIDEIATAFARYEDIRKERTAMVVRKSQENRRLAFSPALADSNAIALSVARDWQEERTKERLDWLYAYDATAIAI
jgi:salicylate hydroxylase